MVAVPSTGRASLLEPQLVAPEATAAHGLYERHAARIHGYCLHQLGSREEAEDAVQTTFMNAFRSLGKGVVPEAEAAWLFKIAENVCLSRRRSSWRRNRIESPADFEVIGEVVPGPDRQRDELIGIEEALAAMPEQQRRAILLREWQGLSYREISAELKLSQSAVETLIFRARRSLALGLTEPARAKPRPEAPREGLRRTLHVIDLTTLLGAAKSLLTGAAALKATTAAVVVTAAAGTAVTVTPSAVKPPPKPALAVLAAAPVPRAALVAVVSSPSPPAAPAVVERTPAARWPAKPVPSGNADREEARPAFERKAVRAEQRAVRKAARAEVRAERKAARLARRAEQKTVRAERKAKRIERRAERKAGRAQLRTQLRSQRQADRAARRAERRADRVQRRAERQSEHAQRGPDRVGKQGRRRR